MKVSNDASLTIGTASTVVSQHVFNGVRKVVALHNVSTGGQDISLAWNADAKDQKGIVLKPLDRYVESMDAGYTPSPEQITAISSGAGGVLSIHEIIEIEDR